MLVTMETHVPLNQRENPPPPPDSSVVCTYKIAGTLTYENSLPLYVQNNSAGNRTSIGTKTAVKRHAKAQVPTNWTQSCTPFLPFQLQGRKKRSISTDSKGCFFFFFFTFFQRQRQKEQQKRDLLQKNLKTEKEFSFFKMIKKKRMCRFFFFCGDALTMITNILHKCGNASFKMFQDKKHK